MTLGLKEWIAKVSALAELLSAFKNITSFGINSSTTRTVTLGNGAKTLWVGCGAGSSKFAAIVNTNNNGNVSYAFIYQGVNTITFSSGSGTVTLNNNSSGFMQVLIIDFR